ncbi:MAG: methyl-accepting chemotaxis protein [Gaiellales bacterium]
MKAIFGLLIGVLAVYTVSLVVRADGAEWTWLDGWGVSAFELVAALVVLAHAARDPRYRAFSIMLGTGMAFWALGDFAMTYETLGGKEPATVSAANILWIGFYPFAYLAVMMLMRQEARKLTLANYLDGVMAALAASALFITFLFSATVSASGGDTANAAINLVYPAGDLFLFGLAAIGIVLLPAHRRACWYVLAIACLVNTAGDVAALFPALIDTRLGTITDAAAWPVSLLLLAIAAWMRPPVSKEELREITPSFVLPALAAGSALMVVLVASLDHTNRVGMLFAAAALATAGIRFGITLKQLGRLTEERHRQLEEAAQVEQASREKLQVALRDLEGAARAEQESREALQAAMRGYTDFSARAAQGASQQSAAIAQTSTTVDEVRIAANTTAEKATEVAEKARDSLRVSDEGAQAVATIADAMEEIRARVEEIASDILALSGRTQQISEITETVKQLAERSKLLALNASIEAARAGEHGRGFAVVADEVRSLSEQSKAATAQVENALAEIQDATAAAVTGSTEGTKVVEKGLELTGRAGAVIHSLAETIREAAESGAEIATSAHQERIGIDQIASSMRNVNDAAEQLHELYRGLQEPDTRRSVQADAA